MRLKRMNVDNVRFAAPCLCAGARNRSSAAGFNRLPACAPVKSRPQHLRPENNTT